MGDAEHAEEVDVEADQPECAWQHSHPIPLGVGLHTQRLQPLGPLEEVGRQKGAAHGRVDKLGRNDDDGVEVALEDNSVVEDSPLGFLILVEIVSFSWTLSSPISLQQLISLVGLRSKGDAGSELASISAVDLLTSSKGSSSSKTRELSHDILGILPICAVSPRYTGTQDT